MMKESKKEAIKRELIECAGYVSDSIKLRQAKDDFTECLPGILEDVIRRHSKDTEDKKELHEYLKPILVDIIQNHNSR